MYVALACHAFWQAVPVHSYPFFNIVTLGRKPFVLAFIYLVIWYHFNTCSRYVGDVFLLKYFVYVVTVAALSHLLHKGKQQKMQKTKFAGRWKITRKNSNERSHGTWKPLFDRFLKWFIRLIAFYWVLGKIWPNVSSSLERKPSTRACH